LHAARCRAICAALLLDEADEGCAGAGADGGAFGAVSALRLPADRDLPWPRRSRDELRARAPSVAAVATSGAAQASAKARRNRPPTSERSDGRQPGVVLRLRVRLVRQRSAAQVPDGHRRMDQRGSCDRGRRPHPLPSRDRSAVAAGVGARRAVSALGQRARVRLPRVAEVDRRPGHRHRIDRSGQALAEWFDGELQRQVPRRVPEPRMVPVTDRGEGADRSVAAALQHGASAFEPRLSHAGRVRREDREARRSDPANDGADRCGVRASALRPVAQPSRKGQTKATGQVIPSILQRPIKASGTGSNFAL